MTSYTIKQREEAWTIDKYGKSTYQSGNDPANPNGMKPYKYKGVTVWAYCYKDFPMRYRELLNGEKWSNANQRYIDFLKKK